MQNYLDYIQDTIEIAFCRYFQMDIPAESERKTYCIGDNSFLQKICQAANVEHIDEPESIILGLALAPHFAPRILDLFLVENKVFKRPYTEFGGRTGSGYTGFVPTAETAMFVLTAGNAGKRIEMMPYFRPQHWLYTSGMIQIRRESVNDPLFSGVLGVSGDFLDYLCGESSGEPVRHLNEPRDQLLDKKTARNSPCLQCSDAPCCKLLHLEDFPIASLVDFDKIGYYLNFENIEAILSPGGKCTIYYSATCRFFQEEDATCSIHNQKEQPSICMHYSPYRCFYKHAEKDKKSIEYGNIWLNQERLSRIQEMVLFDEDRQIAQVPPFQEMVQVVNTIPYRKESHSGSSCPETFREEMSGPCSRCGALCCTHLLFPSMIPSTRGNLDYYQYTLGFPGVEYLVTNKVWGVLVHTRCKYLNKGNGCSVYNKDERPLYCRYFDPYKCYVRQLLNTSYKVNLNYDNFSLIKGGIYFDELGNFKGIESVEVLQTLLDTDEIPCSRYMKESEDKI